MAKYADGTNRAKAADPSSANILDPGTLSGKIRVMVDNYTFGASSLNSTDYILIGGKLPTGAQVIDLIITAGSPLVTATATLVVGDEGDVDRYLTSYQLTAGYVQIGMNVSGGMNYKVTGITDNYIRIAGAATNSVISGAIVKVAVLYTVE